MRSEYENALDGLEPFGLCEVGPWRIMRSQHHDLEAERDTPDGEGVIALTDYGAECGPVAAAMVAVDLGLLAVAEEPEPYPAAAVSPATRGPRLAAVAHALLLATQRLQNASAAAKALPHDGLGACPGANCAPDQSPETHLPGASQ